MPPTSPDESIFFKALEQPTPADRERYLDEACRGDGELRRRVERLLSAHPHVGGVMGPPPAGAPPAAAAVGPDDPTLPTAGPAVGDADAVREVADLLAPSTRPGALGRLEHYEVLEVVGRGGM